MSSTQVKAAEECQIATKDLKSQQSNQKDECSAEENGKQNGVDHNEKEIKHKSPQKKSDKEDKDSKTGKQHKNGNEEKTEENGTTNVKDDQQQNQTTAAENKESHVEKTENGANGSTNETVSPSKKKPLEEPEVEGPEMKKARRSLTAKKTSNDPKTKLKLISTRDNDSEKDANKKIDDGSEDKTAEAVKTN
uniref:Uncharacterized protein n=1 Tax=Romanomermis culicivorax TaxID=13658 RepID=A0A915IEV0_ROMCU